jgi:hypothetical protein
LAEV